MRRVWPDRLPLFVRISSTDWTDGGWTIEDSIALAARLKTLGVDVIDCSSGGNVAHATIPARPRLSGAVRRADQTRGWNRNRRRRSDHRSGAGGADPRLWSGRSDRDGAGAVTRSVPGRFTPPSVSATRRRCRRNIGVRTEPGSVLRFAVRGGPAEAGRYKESSVFAGPL